MKFLGIDFGLRRIGLAVSDGELSSPYKTLEVRNLKDGISQVLEVIEKEGFEIVIVGLPEGKIGQTVLGFIKSLRKNGLEVIEADETLSSKQALENMIEQGVSKKKRGMNDSAAAAIILQNWLDENQSSSGRKASLD